MAELILDLGGLAGLAEGFSGDEDMITPQPQRIVNVRDGEMAGGLFNPYLRKGYLSPISSTSTAITPSGTPDTKLTSVVYDADNSTLYLSDRGTHIYRLDGLTDTSMALDHTLAAGSVIQDLEVYLLNNKRHLYYLYTTTGLEDSVGLSRRGTWMTTSVEVNPLASIKPRVIASHSEYSSNTTHSVDIVVPTGSNIACIVHIGTSGTVTSVSADSVAMTLVSTTTSTTASVDNKTYIYSIHSLSGGTITLDFVTSSTFSYNAVFTDNTSTSPATVVGNLRGITANPITQATYSATKLLLSFLYVDNAYGELSSSPTVTTYDEGTQTGSNGWGIALKSDGTKMYLNGTTHVYQYTLGTAWQISSGVTYDSVSLSIAAQFPSGNIGSIRFNTDGTKMYIHGYGSAANFVVKQYDLGTAWNLSTAVYNAAKDSPSFVGDGFSNAYGMTMTRDGTDFYLAADVNQAFPGIYRYTMSTPFDFSTATLTSVKSLYGIISTTSSSSGGIFINANSTVLYITSDVNQDIIEALNFDPRYPKDSTKLTIAISSTGIRDSYTPTDGAFISSGEYANSYMYYRRNAGSTAASDVVRLAPQATVLPSLATTNKTITSAGGTAFWTSASYMPSGQPLECGVGILPFDGEIKDDTWLTGTLETRITSQSNHNFIVPADNGFAYIFAGNAVHKIDGGSTGGSDGSVTKNVLLFPETFTITDAVDFRSKMYMALHQYNVDVEATSLTNYSGRCGILMWDRRSVVLGGTDYIELPGVREIKKIYASPDGIIKLLVIADSGLTQLRVFGYNDSGGVVFPVAKTLGIGAYPQFPDGMSLAGDKVVWLANDGNLYCEKDKAVSIIHQVKAPGATTALKANNIASGITFYGSGSETASTGYRSNKQGIILSYLDTATKYYKKIYPFDLTTGSNGAQTPNQGDVYTGVKMVPITSKVNQVRVYNAPTASSGSTAIATVKLYFNQSTSATMPNGMTKTVTLDEAKRGYVDFHINKQYVHAIQLEIEWATGTPIGDDMYMPSYAVISYEDTTTKSPDNG